MTDFQDASLIRWLAECLRRDRGYGGFHALSSGRVSHLRVLTGREELAMGEGPEMLLSPAYSVAFAKSESLYRREREALYGCLLLVGESGGKRWSAPVILFPASLQSPEAGNDYWPLTMESADWRLNPAIRSLVDDWELLQTRLSELMPLGELGLGVVGQVAAALTESGCTVDGSELRKWPELCDKSEVDSFAREKSLALLPAACLALVERSREVSGVLDELERIAGDPSGLSQCAQAFLSGKEPPSSSGREVSSLDVPALLSHSQMKLVESAQEKALTVCYGPPGTGKSFTIAAIAAEAAFHGKSVLISSRNNEAVDIVHDKLRALTGGGRTVIRAGRKEHLKQVKDFVSGCLSGRELVGLEEEESRKRKSERLDISRGKVAAAASAILAASGEEERLGRLDSQPKLGLLGKLRSYFLRRKCSRRHVSLRDLAERYIQAQVALIPQLREVMDLQMGQRLQVSLEKEKVRAELVRLSSALAKRRSQEQEEVFREMDFAKLSQALPIWLVNLNDVHRVLPLRREMVDLVIIDEASQCDISSLLPLLQRGVRAVIVGDPQQLRHVSFVPENVLGDLAKKHALSAAALDAFHYRRRSALDLAMDRAGAMGSVSFLDEYFRSPGGLIRFNNTAFYGGKLRIMQAGDASVPEFQKVMGSRAANGVNGAEVTAVVEQIRAFLSSRKGGSLGVISPFRDQVDAVEKAVRESFSTREMSQLIGKRDFMIGTPFSFQGNERDTMILTLALDDSSPAMAWRYLETEGVLNVTTSRSRKALIVFHSFSLSAIPQRNLVRRFFAQETNDEGAQRWWDGASDQAHAVVEHFRAQGFTVEPGPVVAGVNVDLFLTKGMEKIAVDLIGFQGVVGSALTLNECHILQRAGVIYWPLGAAEWLRDDGGGQLTAG